jgi:PAS domain S-box-containing protein
MRAEGELRESEERYRNLLEVAPVGIAVHSDGKVVFTNPAGARLLGADTEELIVGKPVTEFIHPDGWPKSQARIRRMLAGERGANLTRQILAFSRKQVFDLKPVRLTVSFGASRRCCAGCFRRASTSRKICTRRIRWYLSTPARSNRC